MNDLENVIFDTVATALGNAFSGIFVSSESVAVPANFPCATLVEMDNTTNMKTYGIDAQERHVDLMYQADAYSNLSVGKKTECKNVMKVIDETMLNLGFVRIGKGPFEMPNADKTIYRIVARYVGSLGKTISGIEDKYHVYRR